MFTVKKCFARSEIREDDFTRLEKAKDHIQKKLQEDIKFNVKATYRIYEGSDLLEELTQQDAISISPPESSSDSQSSSQQQGNEQIFSPSPLSTKPRPGGMPTNWKDVKKEDKND